MDQYAVLGFPIGHSLSPVIHRLFAEQTQQTLSYEAIEVEPEKFNAFITTFFEQGGKGANCTIPLKELAFECADELTERAKFSGAVNTLKRLEDGKLLGDNTDGIGLITDLCQTLGVVLKQKRVLVLGAGGAARGVLGPLLEQTPAALWVANRTVEKANTLKNIFSPLGTIEAVGFDALAGQQFDVVINATSTSLSGELPPLPVDLLSKHAVCYDLAYSKIPTAFVQWGEKAGAALAADGLGMLVEQAAEAFYVWRGVKPETKAVKATILSKI